MGRPSGPILNSLRMLPVLTACALASTTFAAPLRVGTNVWPGYEPLYLARAEGHLPESEVKLVQFRSATQVMNALRTESIEAGAVTLDEAISLAAGGLDLTIVRALDTSSGADAIVCNADIGSMAELAGKRVGVENSALGAYMLLRALELSGLDLSQIHVIPLDPGGQATAMEKNEADAVVCFEPVRGNLLRSGAKELFNSTMIPGEIVDLLVVRTAVLNRFSTAISNMQAAWTMSLASIEADAPKAYAIMGRRLGLDGEKARESFQGLTLLDCEQNAKLFQPGGAGREAINRLHDFMWDKKLISGGSLPKVAVMPSCDGEG